MMVVSVPSTRPKRRLRGVLYGFGGLFAVASAAGGLALAGAWSALGGTAGGARRARMEAAPQWSADGFQNAEPMANSARKMLTGLLNASPDTRPRGDVAVVHPDAQAYASAPQSGLRVTWFGHSATLVEVDGVRLLTDPHWSERASPVSWAGPTRFFPPPLALADLPPVDAVVISHDHYDHLDMQTVQALASTGARFIVPLGVGAHLNAWGIDDARIDELEWWQTVKVGAVEVTSTPARHASGRFLKQSQTLWSSYAFVGPAHRVFFSGDTGLFAALAEIGARLGPFDVTLIESGQYDAAWPDWHLGPEQAVVAHRLVRGKLLVPIHWALFALAYHAWTEPAERVLAAAGRSHDDVWIPHPGEPFEPALPHAVDRWWPNVPWRTAAEAPVVAAGVTVDPGVAAGLLGPPSAATP